MPKFLDVTNPAFARRALAAAGVDNSPSGLAATAAALGAHLYVDYNAGIYQRDGLSVSAASAIMHNTVEKFLALPVPYLNVNPPTTNDFPVTAGGSSGILGSGGAFYTGWTVENPGGYPVTFHTVGPYDTNFEFSTTLTPYVSQPSDGVIDFISTPIPGANQARHLSFILQAKASNLDQLQVEAGWNYSFTTAGASVATIKMAGGGGRMNLELPASGNATDNLRIRFKNLPGNGNVELRAHMREFSLYVPAVSSGLVRDVQPPIAAGTTLPSRDVTVYVANGDYFVFAWTEERGIVGGRVTATNGSFSLLSAIGNGRVTKIAVWEVSKYSDAAIEAFDPPNFHAISRFDNAFMQRASDKIGDLEYFSGPPVPSFYVATNRFGRTKVEVRPGDHDPNSRLDQNRSEVIFNKIYPYDTDIWTSFAFKTDKLSADPEQYGLIWQWLDLHQPGYNSRFSPSLYVMLWPQGTVTIWTISNTDPAPTAGVPAELVWCDKFKVGEWNHVVMRSRHSTTGGGMLGAWFNGDEVFAYQNRAVGYASAIGLNPHYGYYGAETRNTVVIEHANVEFGARDLSSRINNPLPI